MNLKRRHKRIIFICASVAALGLAIAFLLGALKSNLEFFMTPSELAQGKSPAGKTIRVGGLVEAGSIKRDGIITRFSITDTANRIPVVFDKVTPDLFKEGKGCVVVGRMQADGVFHADTVMAKHDENYMPPEAGRAIDKARVEKTISQQ
jgi:cytochrome c-type biogenesis protein CcmE